MSLKLPNDKIVYNLQEQVGVNAENIKYLAEVYKNIDSIPAQFAEMKTYFDDTMMPTFSDWTTTFEGWDTTLSTYLANMSSAAVGAISGQNIAPATVSATTSVSAPSITGDSIIEKMSGYSFVTQTSTKGTIEYIYAGIVKNGNKLTIALAFNFTKNEGATGGVVTGRFMIPSAIMSKIYTSLGSSVDVKNGTAFPNGYSGVQIFLTVTKYDNFSLYFNIAEINALTAGVQYYIRHEVTILLSDSLLP